MPELTLNIALRSARPSLKNFTFVHPVALAVLALREKRGEVKTIGHEGPVSTFLSRMGYYDYAGISDPHRVKRGGNLKTIEIGPAYPPDQAIDRIRILLGNDPSVRTLELMLIELGYNVETHANSEGIIAGQVIDGCVEIAVVDHGIGIQKSLSENPKYSGIDERTALEISLQKGVTNGKGRGFGLWSTTKVLKDNGGYFCIGSGKSRYYLPTEKTEDSPYWSGTYTQISYNLKKPVDYSLATGLASDYKGGGATGNEGFFDF